MTVLVEARGLAVELTGRRVLDGVDLTLAAGEELALVGRSGSGKSTLLLALAGLLQADAGSVAWPALSGDRVARSGELTMVFQAPSLLAELTAVQNVALPLRLRGLDPDVAYRAANDALASVGLVEAADAVPQELSGGQQQRVAVARAVASGPRVVLADEPTGSLDADTAATVVAVLRDAVRATGGALVLATHDLELAASLPGRLELQDGVVRRGPASTTAADPAGSRRVG
jgi:putative ABC transport system ATP-binding protein